MKKFKGLKKVTALALCGIMCLGSTMSASASDFSNPRVITNDEGIVLSNTYIYRDSKSYSIETVITKNHYGVNNYSSSIDAKLYIRNDELGRLETRNHKDSVVGGTTRNPKVSYKYTDFTILKIFSTVITNGYDIKINY